MKQIVIPGPVSIIGAQGKMAFEEFFLDAIAAEKPWLSTADHRRALKECSKAIVGAQPGDTIGLTNATHEKLSTITTGIQLLGRVKVSLMPFIDAITDAADAEEKNDPAARP